MIEAQPSRADEAEDESRVPYGWGVVAALALGAVGFGVAYGLWLARGCVALPMVSDLGLRAPEAHLFHATIAVIIPLTAFSAAMKQKQQFDDLRKSGKSPALWLVTVAAGCAACVGAFVTGFTAWDETYWTHFWGAIVFFSASWLFVLGTLGLWTQLGYMRPHVPPSRWVFLAWFFLVVAFVAGCVGLPLFFAHGPIPPCSADADSATILSGTCTPQAEREISFGSFCAGIQSSHSTVAGQVMSAMEWIVLVSICVSVASVVLHDAPCGAPEARALLGEQPGP